ncbi:MAG: hypothetical protein RL574_659 [Actinomycetota bacterium]
MSDIPTDITSRRKPRRRWSLGITVAAILAIGAFIVASSSSAESYDANKVVANAEGKSADYGDNTSGDCDTEAFLGQEQDLWHFVVAPQNVRDGDESYKLSAEITAVHIKWQGIAGVVRYTGTDDYDQGNAGANLFWVYTEPGRTIEQAWLEYVVTRDDLETPTETYLTSSHNLSHACASDYGSEPPTIQIDSVADYDMVYDLVYDWDIDKTVDAASLLANGADPYVLRYSIDAVRVEPPVPGNYRIVDGSMIVTGTVDVTDAEMSDIVVTTPGGNCLVTDDANTSDGNYIYTCVIISEPAVTSAAGLDGQSVTVTGVVTTDAGTATDNVVIPWGEPDSLTVDDVLHATAYIVDGERRSETSAGPLSLDYSITWQPEECPDQRVNVAELFDGATEQSLGVDDTLTISGCPPVPGLTIGYWGNKMGAPQVVNAFAALAVKYPALAAIPITSEASVRSYFTKASCSGDCMTMFLAQALGTAMNARSGSFGDQPVYFDGQCKTVDSWLDIALRTAIPTDRATRIAFKSLFDDLNNTRAIRCASVS